MTEPVATIWTHRLPGDIAPTFAVQCELSDDDVVVELGRYGTKRAANDHRDKVARFFMRAGARITVWEPPAEVPASSSEHGAPT